MNKSSTLFVAPTVPGFVCHKLLAASHHSAVHLATDNLERRVALKTLRIPEGVDRQTWDSKWIVAQRVTAATAGLLPILEFGLVEQRNVWYYSLPAADDASDEAAGNLTLYNPLTLRLRLKVGGPLRLSEVIDIGLALSEGLRQLHAEGLAHRDVKPSNIFFVHGEPRLGDYDLMLAPESQLTPRGTEGFYPISQHADCASDVYALGKTLYEAWTGLDRLEFPSLPPGLAGGADWNPNGAALNQVLLKACAPRVNFRFADAAELHSTLEKLISSCFATGRERAPLVRSATMAVTAIVISGAALAWWFSVPGQIERPFPSSISNIVQRSAANPDSNITYDAAEQFSRTENPAGVWSYGYSPRQPNAFVPFTNGPGLKMFPHSNVPITFWERKLANPANYPVILKSHAEFSKSNNLDLVMSAGKLAISSGQVPSPTYGVVRFSAPQPGLYTIRATFLGVQFSGEFGGTTTDVHILVNGSSVFDRLINGFGESQSYVSPSPVSLESGATIDFAVGPGSNGTFECDFTELEAVVTHSQ